MPKAASLDLNSIFHTQKPHPFIRAFLHFTIRSPLPKVKLKAMTSAPAPAAAAAHENIVGEKETNISENRPAKRQKMDEAEVKKYETESAKLAKVEDYRTRMRGVAQIKPQYAIFLVVYWVIFVLLEIGVDQISQVLD